MPTSAPRIAVIVTTHDYGRYLPQCLDSILAQTLPAAELIVVDDASADDTREVMARYPQARYHRVEFRNGNRARNFGFAQASSELVLFFDADNHMAPQMLERLHAALGADPGADFAYSDRLNFFEAGSSGGPVPVGLFRAVPFDPARLRRSNYIDLAAMLRARCFPGFDEDLRRLQDWEFWLHVVVGRGGRGVYVPEPLFFYRLHEASVTRREDRAAAAWYVRRKYRLGLYARVPLLRDWRGLYRVLIRVKQAMLGHGS